MAEIAGIVISGVGLVAAAREVKALFLEIDTARNLGKDYEQYSLQLDLARLAFNRWTEAVRLTDANNASSSPINLPVATPRETEVVKKLLGNIQAAFQDAERTGERYYIEDSIVPNSTARQGTLSALSQNVRQTTENRQRGVKLVDKLRWVVKDANVIKNLVSKVDENVKSLVELFPTATRQIQETRAAQDAADIAPAGSDTDIVNLLKSVAAKTDPVLENCLGQAVRHGHYVKGAKALGKSRVLYGNEYGEGAKDLGNRWTFHNVVANDEAKVQYGDRMNVKSSFWDEP